MIDAGRARGSRDQTSVWKGYAPAGSLCVLASLPFEIWPFLGWIDSCPAGFACDSMDIGSGVCRPVAAAGSRCSSMEICVEGNVCRDGVCSAFSAPITPCAGSADCPDHWDCVAGACVGQPYWMRDCAVDDDCQTFGGTCESGVCQRAAAGSPCPRGFECPICTDGICQPWGVGRDGDACDESVSDFCDYADGFLCLRTTDAANHCCAL